MARNSRLLLILPVTLSAVLATTCSGATAPTPVSGVKLTAQFPQNGATVTMPAGNLIMPGTGILSFDLTVTSGRESPWAQLNVYLLANTGDPLGYCGQNTPDSPTWGPFNAGQTVHVKISGFHVYRIPCDVTGIRVMLHLRNNGNLMPPTQSETLAEATLPVSYRIQH